MENIETNSDAMLITAIISGHTRSAMTEYYSLHSNTSNKIPKVKKCKIIQKRIIQKK
jgi:hypothetical protein